MEQQQIHEIPIELTIHGKVKVRAVDRETAESTVMKMKLQRLRQFFKEDFAFRRIAERHVIEDEIQGNLEETNGEADDNNLQSESGIHGEQEELSGSDESEGLCAGSGD